MLKYALRLIEMRAILLYRRPGEKRYLITSNEY